MAKPKETLSSLFAPPENLYGIGGVLCAFSSDADFLEQALLRFTRVPPGSRRSRGSVDFTLMLDPAHEILAQDVVPGLLQLRPKDREHRPWQFQCMHAKVALLNFGPARMGKPTQYRIIVSTGNWTKASAQQQIEFAWYLDIHSLSPKEDRWELYKVASFLQNLLGCYQTSDVLKVHGWLNGALKFGVKPSSGTQIRFMDSSGQSLLSQLCTSLKDQTNACNYLVCGSGFFEQKHDPQDQPKVLQELVTRFQQNGILTRSIAHKLLVTNGNMEDQVVAAFKSNALAGWELRRPKDPVSDGTQPRMLLHAKFIFVAKNRAAFLSSCWLYLGSGNLSIPGMVKAPPSGNIEAGVIIPVPELDTRQKVMRQFPIGSKFEKSELDDVAYGVVQPTEKAPDQPPSPIILFQVLQAGILSIVWDTTVKVKGALEVLLPDGSKHCLQPQQATLDIGQLQWPRSLEIQGAGFAIKVPCLDAAGDFKRQPINNPTFENWLDMLAGFPETFHDPDVDEDNNDDGDEDGSEIPDPVIKTAPKPKRDLKCYERDFPAHTAMMLVETMADRNGNIPEENAADWIHYLRHILLEIKPDSQIEGWRTLQINFLTALLSPEGFAPPWTDLITYRDLILDVAKDWGLEGFPALELSV